MKAYHQLELEDFVSWAHDTLKGSQLQDIESYEEALVLGFYIQGRGTKYLVFEMNKLSPMAFLFDKNPFSTKKKIKPVGLFISAHGKNLQVQKIESLQDFGRIFTIFLSSSERKCQIQVHLIPKAANILVVTDEKNISWNKPKEIIHFETPPVDEVRSITAIHNEWLKQRKNPEAGSSSPELKIRKKLEKDLEKKKKALSEIQKTLDSKENEDWYKLGELLKTTKMINVGSEWDVFLDRKRNQAWNLEQCFQKAKQLVKKRQGTLDRKEIVESEIHVLENQMEGEISRLGKAEPATLKRKLLVEVKTRKKVLDSGIVAFLGKSADDNMKILRQSQAWDLWLHLRDYPSAHAIIQRNKNQEIPQGELNQVAAWLAQESLQKKILLPGTRLEIVYTECRHVRPIKGDKLGRVQYQNERHFMLVLT